MPERLLFRVILLLGAGSALAFHSSGALDLQDARAAAALGEGTVTGRALSLGVDLVRLVDTRIGLFHALHLFAGALLAVAAALTAAVAFCTASAHPGTAAAAALFAGAALLFGGDTGAFGLRAGPVPLLLVLLSGGAYAWTRQPARPLTGGLLLGVAVAAHPFVLFLLPGLAWLPRGAGRSATGRAALGILLGGAALHLPPPGGAVGGAIDAWWTAGGGGAFWSPASPASWGEGALRFAQVLWRGAGPFGILAAAAGVGVLFRTRSPLRFVLLLLHGVPALALVVSRETEDPVAASLAAWTLLLLAAPGWVLLGKRLGADANEAPRAMAGGFRTAGIGLLAGAWLLAGNHATVNGSRERGTAWARDAMEVLPANAFFLTGNLVQQALSRDGVRPDVETRVVTGMSDEEIRALFDRQDDRPVVMDSSVYFSRARNGLLDPGWKVHPRTTVLDVLPVIRKPAEEVPGWGRIDSSTDSPPSPLREGLSTREHYARSLIQSAFLRMENADVNGAEDEFVYALSHPETNHTLAALGLARIYYDDRGQERAIATLERYAREEDPGAWRAFDLLGSAYVQQGRLEEGVATLRRAAELVPPELGHEREKIERRIERMMAP